jgi:hypothetical protein
MQTNQTGCIPKAIIPVLLLLCCSASQMAAQDKSIQGRLVDEKNAPVKFANVTLLKTADSTFMAGAITDTTGHFSLPAPTAGSWFLQFTAIGYTEKRSEPFVVTAAGFYKDFGTITLNAAVKDLQHVTVTAFRPAITQLADRMVVHIEGTALAAGSTAFAVLARAPGVFIDQEGNIQLNGRSGVTVMIDGRLTYLSARDLRNLLESMPAENIRNIEIITNPSAKFDAEGTGGILNINLKKNTRQGMNGSLYTGDTWNGKQHAWSIGGSINYKIGRWNAFLNIDVARRAGGREATFTRVFYGNAKTTYFDQQTEGNWNNEGPVIRGGTDYHINDRHSIGFTVNHINNKGYNDFLTNTYIGNAANHPTQYIDADNIGRGRFKNTGVNLHYVGKFDTMGTTLTTDLDYITITNRRESDFYNYFTDLSNNGTTTDFLYTNMPGGFDIYSAKIDFTRALSKEQKFEMGVKASHVVSDNDSRFYFNNGSLVLDPHRTNHFNYRENIYAAYLNWNGNLHKKWTLQTGLRVENTVSRGESLTTGQVTHRNYVNLFPSVFLQQTVTDNYKINYSYSRRISRPGYGNLNPFRFYLDPYTWAEGNPYLRPQYTHAISMAHTVKNQYTLTLSYNLNHGTIAELPYLNADSATTVYAVGNIDRGYSMNATAVIPVKVVKGWEIQNTITIAKNKINIMVDNQHLKNDRVNYYVQTTNTIQLPFDVRLELTAWYRSKSIYGLYTINPMWRTDIALKRSFFNKQVDVSLAGNDLFKTVRYKFTTNINGNINEFDQYFRWRSMGITIRYNFSRGQKVETKRNTGPDELNRT